MMYESKIYDNCYRRDYSEAYALQMLLRMADYACDESAELINFDDGEIVGCEHFTINIAGRSIDFIMGGPQYDALCKFVDSLAEENGYWVNFKKSRVIDCDIVSKTDYCPYHEDEHGNRPCDNGAPCDACML